MIFVYLTFPFFGLPGGFTFYGGVNMYYSWPFLMRSIQWCRNGRRSCGCFHLKTARPNSTLIIVITTFFFQHAHDMHKLVKHWNMIESYFYTLKWRSITFLLLKNSNFCYKNASRASQQSHWSYLKCQKPVIFL